MKDSSQKWKVTLIFEVPETVRRLELTDPDPTPLFWDRSTPLVRVTTAICI